MPKTLTTKKTTCTMDCPDSCALEVSLENGKISQISGSPDHPNTQGFICTKVSRFAKRVYSPDRILYPLRRSGPKGSGKFIKISWSEAIHEIVKRYRDIISENGSEAILPYHYGGSNGLLGDDGMDLYFFARLGASRIARTLCAAPATAVAVGMYGKMPGVAYQDYVHARCIVIWGANPKVSHIHLVPYLKQARNQGAFIVTIDPKKNFSHNEADLHLPVRPGTDLVLALALIHYFHRQNMVDRDFLNRHTIHADRLFNAAAKWDIPQAAQVCGIDAAGIRLFADQLANRSTTVIRCGWGVERNKNGGQAIAAILALPAILNKFGIRGGGYTMSNSGALKLDTQKLFGPVLWKSRELNMTRLGQLLNGPLSPPVKSLFIYNCNPVATVPDQNAVIKGLKREDLFTVVHEQVKTDTALYADLILPAVTFLEQDELKRGYGSYVLGGVQKVIEAQGESKTNEALFAELGRAFGWDDAPFYWNADDYYKKIISALQSPCSLPHTEYFQQGQTFEISFENSPPVQFKTVWPATPDGKVNLCPAVLGEEPYRYESVTSNYPYILISPATSRLISSTLGEFNFPELRLHISPADAAREDINTDDTIRVFNHLGEVICKVRVDPSLRHGVVMMPKGAWKKASLNDQTANALCPDHVNLVGGGACYNDARVRIKKI